MEESPQPSEPSESPESIGAETSLRTELVRLAAVTAGVCLLLFVLFALAWDASLLEGAGIGI